MANSKPFVRRFTDEQEAAMCLMYRNGNGLPAVALAFGLTKRGVWCILRKHGEPTRYYTRRCQLNESAFDDAENRPLAAQFVGLMMSDGCVQQWAPPLLSCTITLALAHRDAHHVYDFRTFLGSTHTIRQNAGNAHFGVKSRRLGEALARYGVGPRKSFTAEVKVLERSPDFWAGMVMGDGGLWVNSNGYPSISLCGSRRSMEQFLSYTRTVVSARAGVVKSGPIWAVTFTGYPAERVTDALLAGRCVGIRRKLEMARRILTDARPVNPSYGKPFACLTPGCVSAKRAARGLCPRCYQRLAYHGTLPPR